MTSFGKLLVGGILVIICGGVYIFVSYNSNSALGGLASQGVEMTLATSTNTTTISETTASSSTTSIETFISSTTPKNLFGYLVGHVTIGPICPVENVDSPCDISSEVYTSREAVVYENDKISTRTRVHLDKKGNYYFAIKPGKYFVQIVPAGIKSGEKKPFTITLSETSTVDFDIDTGIR